MILTDDFVDRFNQERRGVTVYVIFLHLIEKSTEEIQIEQRSDFEILVTESIETLNQIYDYRVYDLRNSTLDEVLTNNIEQNQFKLVQSDQYRFDYEEPN